MKKRPFNAENFQSKAIKCTHCGEWIKIEDSPTSGANTPLQSDSTNNILTIGEYCPVEKPEEKFPNDSIIKKDSVGIIKQGPEKQDIGEDGTHNNDRSGTVLIPPGRWGRGWVILCGMYGYGVQKFPYYHSPSLASGVIPLSGLILLLISHFWFRHRLNKTGKFAEKTCLASAVSGIVSFLVIAVLAATSLSIVGNMYEKAEVKKFFLNTNYQQHVTELEEEEAEIYGALIDKPSSKSDIDQNIDLIGAYLKFMTRKYAISNKYIVFLEKISKSKNNSNFTDEVLKLNTLRDESYDAAQNALNALIIYKNSGYENDWNTYEAKWNDHILFEKDIKSILNNITMEIS
jgi:hypothetical protein